MTGTITNPSSGAVLVPDQRLFREACPTREKVTLHLSQVGSLLDVLLSMPLDANQPDEAAALNLAEDGRLDVPYRVKLDLEVHSKDLWASIQAMYKTPAGQALRANPPKDLSPSQLRAALAPLATRGSAVYFKLFENITSHRFPGHQRVVQTAIRSVLSRPQIVDIRAPTPLFPWALLFDNPRFDPGNLASLDPMRFWGFTHEIQERLDGTSPCRRLPANPTVYASVCSDVDVSQQHWLQTHPFASVKIERGDDVGLTGTALAGLNHDCFYFYGHASQNDPPTSPTSWLKLRGVQLTVADLAARYGAPSFGHDPTVVFLNGCRTAQLSRWDEESLVGFLCHRGNSRVCCVATVAEVPEVLAIAMAEAFWKSFVLERKPIGRALLDARVEMLQSETPNPLGLVYAIFGRVDTQLGDS